VVALSTQGQQDLVRPTPACCSTSKERQVVQEQAPDHDREWDLVIRGTVPQRHPDEHHHGQHGLPEEADPDERFYTWHSGQLVDSERVVGVPIESDRTPKGEQEKPGQCADARQKHAPSLRDITRVAHHCLPS